MWEVPENINNTPEVRARHFGLKVALYFWGFDRKLGTCPNKKTKCYKISVMLRLTFNKLTTQRHKNTEL